MLYLIRVGGYIAAVTFYGVMGWLNFIQAGKVGFLGALSILTVTSWTTKKGQESRPGRVATFITFLLFAGIISFQGFVRDIFGVAHDDIIVIAALFNTDGSEASEFVLQNISYIGKHLVVILIVAGVYWFLLGWKPRRSRTRESLKADTSGVPGKDGAPVSRQKNVLPLVLTVLLLLVHLNPTTRKENPLLYFPIRHAKWQKDLKRVEQVRDRIDAAMDMDEAFKGLDYTGNEDRTVVFVIGESTTRLNWSMYGYPRKTTPQLEAMGKELLSFRDVITTAASTVGDIQLIMGPATREDPGRFEKTPDLLSMARKVGYKTFWITNHTTDLTGSIAIIAKHADEIVSTNRGGSRTESSYDEVVLPALKTALEDPAHRKFIVLHLLGAHPVFYFRYPKPFAVFNGVEDEVTREMKKAGRNFGVIKWRGFYDNAMLYSDHVLKKTIDLCGESGQSVAWLYIPDHGEDVGHYTNFIGHNHRVPAMYEIPMILWRSPSYPEFRVEPEQLAQRPYQTDRLDHTLLGLMGISGEYYDPAADILSPDFTPAPRSIAGKPYGKSRN
ncbi:MAG: phosphoethanolamine transferase [bacterium]|nr:phosphoethanolamine transferase [bacterium]